MDNPALLSRTDATISKHQQLDVFVVTSSHRQAWNHFVAHQPTFSLLQSFEWGEFKEALGWVPVRLAVRREDQWVGAAQVLIKPLPVGSIAYIPRGPLVDWQDREAVLSLLEAIHQQARARQAIFLRIEPPLLHHPTNHALLRSYGFRPTPYTNQPRCTMIVHLPERMDDLLKQFPASTRYNIRLSRRRGVEIKVGTAQDLSTFYRLMQITGRRGRFPIRPAVYYHREWETFHRHGQVQLLIACYQGRPIAAQMPFVFGSHAASFHAGSVDGYRNLKAGYLMMWEAMKWAHAQGSRTFDLWGIPDEVGELTAANRPIPKGRRGGLWGVYYFKRAFRGEVVYYVGAYDHVYKPWLHRTVAFATKRLGSLDRMAQLMDYFSLGGRKG